MDGREESSVPFEHAVAELSGLKRYRTFGEDGPMYEVLSVSPKTVRIYLYNSDSEADYPLTSALGDPVRV